MISKIALIDIDDTLADTLTHMLRYINSKSSQQYLYHHNTREFRENTENDHEFPRLISEFLRKPDLVQAIDLFPFAEEGLKKLKSAGYELHIVSSRQEPLHAVTSKWFELHNLNQYIHDIHPRFAHQEGAAFKVKIAKEIQASVAFEDTFNVARALANNDISVYLIEKPWNESEELSGNMMRVPNFLAGVNLLLEQSNSS